MGRISLIWCLIASVSAQPLPYALTRSSSWAVQYGSTSFDEANCVGVDYNGDVIVGGGTLGNLYGTLVGHWDYFVAKLDGVDGTLLWGMQDGSSATDIAYVLTVDTTGDVVVGGRTTGSIYGTYKGNSDVWVAMVSGSTGDFIWRYHYGTINSDYLRCISITSTGNIDLSISSGSSYLILTLDKSLGILIGSRPGSFCNADVDEVQVGDVSYTVGKIDTALYGPHIGYDDFWVTKRDCNIGTYLFQSECELCSPGYYSDRYATANCKECPEDSESGWGASECVLFDQPSPMPTISTSPSSIPSSSTSFPSSSPSLPVPSSLPSSFPTSSPISYSGSGSATSSFSTIFRNAYVITIMILCVIVVCLFVVVVILGKPQLMGLPRSVRKSDYSSPEEPTEPPLPSAPSLPWPSYSTERLPPPIKVNPVETRL
jgi:hypothetical protein